jgi:hypothetical protein
MAEFSLYDVLSLRISQELRILILWSNLKIL